MDNEIKEEVYRCSKCGQCKSVCPVYKATKNEMYLSRGRYIILNNYFNNHKPLTKEFIRNTDICLNCNLCKDFCPSNIDTEKINTLIKNKYNYKFNIFSFSYFYRLILIYNNILKNIYKIFPFLFSEYRKNLYKPEVVRKKRKKTNINNEKIIFFEGCFNKYINPSDKNAVLNLIEENGYKISKIISNCCGCPYLSDGDIKNFIKNGEKIFKKIDSDCKYIITSCDTCYKMLNKIIEYLPQYKNIKDKLITFDKFAELLNININTEVFYHKPLIRENINIKNEIPSLMENFLIFKHPKIADIILNNGFYSENDIKDEKIYTTCLLAKWGLIKGFSNKKIAKKVLTYAEMIELTVNKKIS